MQEKKSTKNDSFRRKRVSFIRLTFGEKHKIANFIKKNENASVAELSKHFSTALKRKVTVRQIGSIKQDLQKWLNIAFKNSKETHYKFLENDEEGEDESPLAIKRRPKVHLSEEDKKEISKFLLKKRSELTLNEIAEEFAEKLGKDVSRTHIATIRNRLQRKNKTDSELKARLGSSRKTTTKTEEKSAAPLETEIKEENQRKRSLRSSKNEIFQDDFVFKIPEPMVVPSPGINKEIHEDSPSKKTKLRKRKRKNLKIKGRRLINRVMHYNCQEINEDGAVSERWLPVFEVEDFNDVVEFEKYVGKVRIGSEEDLFTPE
ncbi:Oidioi.mRNA.OKI2018_I69.chr1.g990.t1.cds [Oikopleura dioica]|uniref:Oidioi.mRNA.OKI2018_I69.chr1.g990.t1.cds n=1 Tax=Oikopleura dioica TaxID=34765 RepID=A0ABN7SRK4_OIKDI|nr:Oidioi.mRNA.OKI2018_I69.chr1.g990.t1.cds [Oikopleura dioica]